MQTHQNTAFTKPDYPVIAPTLRQTGLDPNFWYPLAKAKALKKGKAIGVSFAGDPIVLVRTKKGILFALQDRCAHRQVPLHKGVVSGDYLKCGYHCWSYDRNGKCVSAPSLATGLPLPQGVRSYPCREVYDLIFVFTGEANLAETTPFPEVSSFANPAYKVRHLNRRIDCHYSFMHENLMDMNHQFLHRKLMGGIKPTLLDQREGDNWVEVDYTFSRVSGKPHIGETIMLGKRVEATEQRPHDLMTIRTEYPYQTLKFWTKGSTEPALDLWNAYIPIDKAQKINHTHGLMIIRKPGIPGLMELFWPFIIWFTEGIFAEDRAVVELEQAAYDAQQGDWNQEIFPPVQALRKLLARKGVALPGRQDQIEQPADAEVILSAV